MWSFLVDSSFVRAHVLYLSSARVVTGWRHMKHPVQAVLAARAVTPFYLKHKETNPKQHTLTFNEPHSVIYTSSTSSTSLVSLIC